MVKYHLQNLNLPQILNNIDANPERKIGKGSRLGSFSHCFCYRLSLRSEASQDCLEVIHGLSDDLVSRKRNEQVFFVLAYANVDWIDECCILGCVLSVHTFVFPFL